MQQDEIEFCLATLHYTKSKNIPISIITKAHKDYLMDNGYIDLTSDGYVLLDKGLEVIKDLGPEQNYKVVYPLTVKGKVGNYNKVLTSMSEAAADALIAAMVNTDFISKVPVGTIRVFIQHFFDNKHYHKLGESLIHKVWNITTESKRFFDKRRKT